MTTQETLETGCYLDNHRGHYITRDMIWLAKDHGYIVDPTDEWLLSRYDEHYFNRDYPIEAIYELAEAALDWLNGGPNEGINRRTPGQNSPPIIPENCYWGWDDGDFGLYKTETE